MTWPSPKWFIIHYPDRISINEIISALSKCQKVDFHCWTTRLPQNQSLMQQVSSAPWACLLQLRLLINRVKMAIFKITRGKRFHTIFSEQWHLLTWWLKRLRHHAAKCLCSLFDFLCASTHWHLYASSRKRSADYFPRDNWSNGGAPRAAARCHWSLISNQYMFMWFDFLQTL